MFKFLEKEKGAAVPRLGKSLIDLSHRLVVDSSLAHARAVRKQPSSSIARVARGPYARTGLLRAVKSVIRTPIITMVHLRCKNTMMGLECQEN